MPDTGLPRRFSTFSFQRRSFSTSAQDLMLLSLTNTTRKLSCGGTSPMRSKLRTCKPLLEARPGPHRRASSQRTHSHKCAGRPVRGVLPRGGTPHPSSTAALRTGTAPSASTAARCQPASRERRRGAPLGGGCYLGLDTRGYLVAAVAGKQPGRHGVVNASPYKRTHMV